MTFGKIGCKMMHEWRNPYVTDGLISMWDGQWNAGNGIHDNSALVWTDISENGNELNESSGAWQWDNDCLVSLGGCLMTRSFGYDLLTNDATIEIVSSGSRLGANRIHLGFSTINNDMGVFHQEQTEMYIGASNVATSIIKTTRPRNKNVCLYKSIILDGTDVELIVDGSGGRDYQYGTRSTAGIINGFIMLGNSNSEYTDEVRVYSCRIYNRHLTTAELEINVAIDKQRFNFL